MNILSPADITEAEAAILQELFALHDELEELARLSDESKLMTPYLLPNLERVRTQIVIASSRLGKEMSARPA